MSHKLIIFGAGKIAQVIYEHFANDSDYTVVAFTVDDNFTTEGDTLFDLPIIPFSQVGSTYPPHDHHMFVAIGYHQLNEIRQQKYQQAKDLGYPLASYIGTPNHDVMRGNIGENCFIATAHSLQKHCHIGDNAFIWNNAIIGHHASIEPHCWITSGTVIGGNTTIGERCFIGMNASIGHEITIGKSNIIGANALVTKDSNDSDVFIKPDTEKLRLNSREFAKMANL